MRYYNIVITNPATGKVLVPASNAAQSASSYTSFVNGVTLGAALNVELDIVASTFAVPVGASYIRVWGISIQEISQASDLRGMNIAIYGGMQKGLPLANPQQAGLLAQGTIFQAFGNWIGVDMTLDLILMPNGGTPAAPMNIVHVWPAKMPLAQAIANTLSTAFPSYKQIININPNLVLAHDEKGYYQTIFQYAQYIKEKSLDVIGGNYPGVDVTIQANTFIVYDQTTQKTPKTIQFQDMIGQPTWSGFYTINFKCVMRGDINVGDYVQMPAAATKLLTQSATQVVRNRSIFQGVFQIQQIRHVGNFRQPDAESWNTTMDAVQVAMKAA